MQIPNVASNQALLRAWQCRRADLDGDGEVTTGDQRVAEQNEGFGPGPAGSLPYEEPSGGDDVGVEPDAGAPDMGDAGVPRDDAGTEPEPDAGPDLGIDAGGQGRPVESEGCSCSTAAPSPEAGLYLLLLAVCVGARRRRRGEER